MCALHGVNEFVYCGCRRERKGLHRLHRFLGLIRQHRPPVVECQGLLHRAGPLCLAFLMVACASQDSTAPLGYDEARAKPLFSEGYQDVSAIYIEEVAGSDLEVAGLTSLAHIAPALGTPKRGTPLSS